MEMNKRRKTDIMCCLCLITALIAFCVSMNCSFDLIDNVRPVNGNIEKIETEMADVVVNVTEQQERTVIVEAVPAPELKSIGVFTLTAYCPCEKCCGKWGENRPVDGSGNPIVYGSTGIELKEGLSVAVDPDVIPYGSEIVIGGHTYVAHDCGGAIKNNRIDVYFSDHNRALEFAVQEAEVFVFE